MLDHDVTVTISKPSSSYYVRLFFSIYIIHIMSLLFQIMSILFDLFFFRVFGLLVHQQTGVLLWHHYDILNKLYYPLWHYYDTVITLMTFTKVRLLWHIMTKARKRLLLHLRHDYYCHYDILNILWHLCVLWHYYIHYHILNYYYTYDIEVLLLRIMTIAKHYVYYTHHDYDTIISIVTFWFFISLMTLRY